MSFHQSPSVATDGLLSCQWPERQYPVLLVDADRRSRLELAAEEGVGQCVLQAVLDHAAEWPGTIAIIRMIKSFSSHSESDVLITVVVMGFDSTFIRLVHAHTIDHQPQFIEVEP